MVDHDGLAARPGKTPGTTRRPRRRHLRLIKETCVACAACPAVCHTLALRMDALQLALAEDLCDNCGACVPVCPVGALAFE